MRKEKTLSLILAIAITLSQSSIFNINRAFASTGKDEADKENLINRDEISMESSLDCPGSEKIDIGNSFTLTNSGDYNYIEKRYTKITNWTLTIKNHSDNDIYLGELSNDSNSRNFLFKDITFDRSGLSEPYITNELKYSLSCYDVKGKRQTSNDLIGDSRSFVTIWPININIKFKKPIRIKSKESIIATFKTSIFQRDYENPFNPEKWQAREKLEPGDIKSLINTDISQGFKGKFYLDPDRENPIVSNKLQDYSQASFRINADIGNLNFPDGVQTFLKKADEESFNKVEEIPSLSTDDTLKFVLPIKIKSDFKEYREFLKESGHKQYLVNPRFIINQDDDESLDQKFYLERGGETYNLESKFLGDNKSIEVSLGNKLPDFTKEFNLVYEVKITNSDRTHGLNKNIKLIYDNSDFIKPNNGTKVNLNADYEEAHKDHQVNFETNGHGEVEPQSVAENGKATEPTKPEKSGYIFEGWYVDEDLKEKFDFNTPITKNTTLYAKWAKLMKISYKFESDNKGESLPSEITSLLANIQPTEGKLGDEIKAPQNIFEDVKGNNGIWSFKGWDKEGIILAEDDDNTFVGKWAFIENPKENPKPDSNIENPTDPKPDQGGSKDHSENDPKKESEKESDPNHSDEAENSNDRPNESQGGVQKENTKSSLDDEDKSNEDTSLKENLTDFSGADEKSSQSDNKNLKETKADLKVVGTNGTSSKKEAKEVKKLDKSQFNKAHKDQKLIGEAEISVKEISKIENSLPNKGKKRMKSASNPKTGIAGMGFVSSILALSSVGFYFSKKSKKD